MSSAPQAEPVRAFLAEVQERYKPDRNGAAAFLQSDDAASDVPRLIAAIEAAVKATDPFDDDQTLGGMFLAAIHVNVLEAIKAALSGVSAGAAAGIDLDPDDLDIS